MLEVEVTERALGQIERAAIRRLQNRPAAPGAIADHLEQAKILLSLQPGAGARSASERYPDLRRLYLSGIKYHIYYRVEPGRVVVLAF